LIKLHDRNLRGAILPELLEYAESATKLYSCWRAKRVNESRKFLPQEFWGLWHIQLLIYLHYSSSLVLSDAFLRKVSIYLFFHSIQPSGLEYSH